MEGGGILEIDAGNTRIKWRLLSEQQVAGRGICNSQDELISILPGLPALNRIRLSSVREPEATAALAEDLHRRWRVEAELARVTAEQAGVRNAYGNFARLGIDRWLAILAAYNRGPGQLCCVISCGTALTIDAVSAEGQHQGGFIVPGLTLQRKSLLQNTAIRLPADIQWSGLHLPDSGLGCSTEQAVDQGILTLLATGLANLPEVAAAAQADALYLTGGDAAPISAALQRLGVNHCCDQDIILDGLAYALP